MKSERRERGINTTLLAIVPVQPVNLLLLALVWVDRCLPGEHSHVWICLELRDMDFSRRLGTEAPVDSWSEGRI
jgi:hypothetical protein